MPKHVDPYLYNYALRNNLSIDDYKLYEENSIMNYLHKEEFDSYLQKAIKSSYVADVAEQALDYSLGLVFAPIDKVAFSLLTFPSCPKSSTTVGCAFESFSSVLYATRSIDKSFVKSNLPFTAYSDPDITKAIRLLPLYQKMRERVYEQAIPLDSPLRHGKGTGPNVGKMKPDWLVDLECQQDPVEFIRAGISC
jgi:hypothetical protein